MHMVHCLTQAELPNLSKKLKKNLTLIPPAN